ncbi:sugar transferase [Streptomyces sp. NPDC058375]|uniref:sugar transferase n=1 Tax=Streptomyces sp. NPDC058375 TaxID=3346467 RepID=UPI003653A5E0
MQNARKPRVRQKNKKNRKSQRNRQPQQTRPPQQPQPPQPPQPRSEPDRSPERYATQSRSPERYATESRSPERYATESRSPEPYPPPAHASAPPAHPYPHPHPHPHPYRTHPYRTPTGTARGHFPSRPAARLADLTDRAGRLADRFAPRTPAERVLDLTLGTALLLLTAPAVAAAALTLTARRTPGGAWDRRPRTGLGGRVFELRTLRTRRFRLDVLSRLPHVVRGDLSLVGPAPLAPGDPRATGPGARQWRQELRPGLTGLAQVRARSGMPWDDPALLDQHYAEHHGVVLDLAILTEAVRDCLRTALRKARLVEARPRHT